MVLTNPFHSDEACLQILVSPLIQMLTAVLWRYLSLITIPHSPESNNPRHKFFRCRASETQNKFRIPQPPFSTGEEILSQATRWNLYLSGQSFHRKLKEIYLNVCRIVEGTLASVSQKTGKLRKIEFSKINLPPKDNFRKVHEANLHSNFCIIQCQSTIL